jgi:hypothetical protein
MPRSMGDSEEDEDFEMDFVDTPQAGGPRGLHVMRDALAGNYQPQQPGASEPPQPADRRPGSTWRTDGAAGALAGSNQLQQFGESESGAMSEVPAANAPIKTRAWLTSYVTGTEMWKPLDFVNEVVQILEAAGLEDQTQVRQPSTSGAASRDGSHSHVRTAFYRRC